MFKRRILSALFSCSVLPLVAAAPAPTRDVAVWLEVAGEYGEEVYVTLQLPVFANTQTLKNAIIEHFGIDAQAIQKVKAIWNDDKGTICEPYDDRPGKPTEEALDDNAVLAPEKKWYDILVPKDVHNLCVALNNLGPVYKVAKDDEADSSMNQSQAKALLVSKVLYSPYARKKMTSYVENYRLQELAQFTDNDLYTAHFKKFVKMLYAIKAEERFKSLMDPQNDFVDSLLNGEDGIKVFQKHSPADVNAAEILLLLSDNVYLDQVMDAIIAAGAKDGSTAPDFDALIARLDRVINFVKDSPKHSENQRDLLILLRGVLIAKKEAALAPQPVPQPGTPAPTNNPQLNPPVPTNNSAPSSQWKTWATYGGMTVIVLTAAYCGYQWFIAAPAQTSEETKPA